MVDKLLRLLDIDAQTRVHGRELWRMLAPHAEGVIDAFYTKVLIEKVHPMVTSTAVHRLKRKQIDHWRALFASEFDDRYTHSAERIGVRHRAIELDLGWYVTGYVMVKIGFINVILQSSLPPAKKGQLIKTLEQYVALDMAFALSTYSATHEAAVLVD